MKHPSPPHFRHLVLASCVGAVLVASPGTAAAQRLVVIQALSELTTAVAGAYGDEGARIGPALDKMAGGLAEWDRAILAFESRLTFELPGAESRVAIQMCVTLGEMYLERGRLADALRQIDEAVRLDPGRADLHMLRGLVLDASARSTEAGQAFRTAWGLDPSDPVNAYYVFRHPATTGSTSDIEAAREALAEAYRRLLRDTARREASPFVGIDVLLDSAADTPVLAPATYAQGYAHLALGNYEEAIAEFRRAAATDPMVTDPATRSASLTQAVAALRQSRLADARSLLEGFSALKDSSEAQRVLGLVYWADSQDDQSIEQLVMAIRTNPRDERSRLALSRVLSSAGRDADAERALQETIRVLPDSAQARWWLGSAYERRNQFADARREFELAATGVVAGRSQFFAAIGRLAGTAADSPGAVNAFERAVSARPNDSTLHKALAGAFLQGDRVDEALVELIATLLIDPRDAGAHAGIGRIHLNAGRYDDAVVALRRAVESSPNDTDARYSLATALMRSGNTPEGARELARVEQEQRRMLADRRRTMTLAVLNEEAALRASEGNHERALALYEQAAALGADPLIYRELAALYAKVGRVEDAARARANYERALQLDSGNRGTTR